MSNASEDQHALAHSPLFILISVRRRAGSEISTPVHAGNRRPCSQACCGRCTPDLPADTGTPATNEQHASSLSWVPRACLGPLGTGCCSMLGCHSCCCCCCCRAHKPTENITDVRDLVQYNIPVPGTQPKVPNNRERAVGAFPEPCGVQHACVQTFPRHARCLKPQRGIGWARDCAGNTIRHLTKILGHCLAC